MNNDITLPALLKLYYNYGFPELLGATKNSIALAIIYKANQLFFPDTFPMSNRELQTLSGYHSGNLPRERKYILNTTLIQNESLITYSEGRKGHAGYYSINKNLVSKLSQMSVKLDTGLVRDEESNRSQSRVKNTPQMTTIITNKQTNEQTNQTTPRAPAPAPAREGDAENFEGGGSSLEPISINQDVKELQMLIFHKWRGQILQEPSYPSCRNALEDFRLDQLEEALSRCPIALKINTPMAALNCVITYAKNTHFGVSRIGKRADVSDEKLEKVLTELECMKQDLTFLESDSTESVALLEEQRLSKESAIEQIKYRIECHEDWLTKHASEHAKVPF